MKHNIFWIPRRHHIYTNRLADEKTESSENGYAATLYIYNMYNIII